MPEISNADGGLGPMRAKMVAALAEFLDIDYERASKALDAVYAATNNTGDRDIFKIDPNLQNPGVAIAHRIQAAVCREFEGEQIIPAVCVAQAASGHVGLAASSVATEEIENLLLLGLRAVRRNRKKDEEEP